MLVRIDLPFISSVRKMGEKTTDCLGLVCPRSRSWDKVWKAREATSEKAPSKRVGHEAWKRVYEGASDLGRQLEHNPIDEIWERKLLKEVGVRVHITYTWPIVGHGQIWGLWILWFFGCQYQQGYQVSARK